MIFYLVAHCIVLLNQIIRHIAVTLTSADKTMHGKIEIISELVVVSKGISAYLITISVNKEKYELYYNSLLEEINFDVGDDVLFVVGNNFIMDVQK